MLKSTKYVPAKLIKEKYAISAATLRKWSLDGKIDVIRTPGGKRLYDSNKVATLFGDTRDDPIRTKIAYARVSSDHQREDLNRQEQDLRTAYPDHKIISDIGSGLNWKRKGFNELLDLCFRGLIKEVAVTHKDRLCRYGFELLETIFSKLDVTLVVLHQSSDGATEDTRELSEDLLSIVTVFVARNNGKRAAENRRQRKLHENTKDPPIPERGSEENTE